MKRDKRKRRFLVGFSSDKQVVYGSIRYRGFGDYADPMTLSQAKTMARELTNPRIGSRAVYELVPVWTVEGGDMR